EAGGKIFEAFVAQRPDWRPFDLGRSIEWGRRLRFVRIGRRQLISPVLRVAEQQDVIRQNGIARREIRKPSWYSDFVALKNSGIALDRLHERASFTLLGGASLAEAAAAQSRSELIDRSGRPRKIVYCMVVGVQGQIGF